MKHEKEKIFPRPTLQFSSIRAMELCWNSGKLHYLQITSVCEQLFILIIGVENR